MNPPNLRFVDRSELRFEEDHARMLEVVRLIAKQHPEATFTAYPTPCDDEGGIEWLVQRSSSAGRVTLELTQRAAHGPILHNNRVLMHG